MPRSRAAFGPHAFVQAQAFRDLLADREERVERRHRLLEDHRDVRAANAAHLLLGLLQQIVAVEQDAPAQIRLSTRRRIDKRGDALARSRFADQRDAFAARDRKAQVLHRGLVAEAQSRSGRFPARGCHFLPPPNAEPRVRVSSALRNASPMKVSSSKVITSADRTPRRDPPCIEVVFAFGKQLAEARCWRRARPARGSRDWSATGSPRSCETAGR
jgi:hypothetical protein